MKGDRERKHHKIPAIAKGCKRQWVKCKECGKVYWYDYVPFSLSQPIMEMPCGHGLGQDFRDTVDYITPDEAIRLLREED